MLIHKPWALWGLWEVEAGLEIKQLEGWLAPSDHRAGSTVCYTCPEVFGVISMARTEFWAPRFPLACSVDWREKWIRGNRSGLWERRSWLRSPSLWLHAFQMNVFFFSLFPYSGAWAIFMLRGALWHWSSFQSKLKPPAVVLAAARRHAGFLCTIVDWESGKLLR